MAKATESSENVEAAAPPVAKLGMMQLLMAVVAGVVISVALLAGTFYYLAKSGKLSLSSAAVPAATKQEAADLPPPPSHALALEPLVVNLADEGGKTYLRVGLTLRVLDPVLKKGEKPKEKPKEAKGPSDAEAAVRDCVLEVLGRQTADALLASEGKDRLKTALKAEITRRDPELKFSDVYFTEFLVQR